MNDDALGSAAERYAAAQRRTKHPQLRAFRDRLGFDLDEFQIASCEALEDDSSVLVAAPTGAGKTIIAEFAIFRAMRTDRDKVFYTTPMKALSNQKFNELVEEYGEVSVGLLTGDTNINAGARVVVMTTEVLRNMLYAQSDLLTDLACVVMDEVHYLADRFRGAVWEEVIIHLPQHVRMVSLSATVSNAEEFGDWLQAVRGDTVVIVSEERPVPLDQHVLVRGRLIDLFDSSGSIATNRVNPELVDMARHGGRVLSQQARKDVGRRHSRGGRPDEFRLNRVEIAQLLAERQLLPAISFIFSRVGCDQAVLQFRRADLRLTTAAERGEIREIVEARCRTLRDEDLGVVGYWDWLAGLERGVAAHHAGLLPAFKEVVEELFQRKLLKMVFATETLALGINMPARTVVLEKLEKFNGEARVPITPGEYTQLTGRAGRRGIDVEGHSVIQYQDGLNPEAIASLASRRTYPLNSSFKPTYNMAVNLLDRFGRVRTREILESSFAQFQADRAVVDLARKVKAQEESLAGYTQAMTCHLGDFRDYSALRRQLTDLERRKLSVTASRGERERRQHELTSLRKRLSRHACHSCNDREAHARWSERYWKLEKETRQLAQQISTRTGAVARVFDRVTDVLVELDYATNDPEHRDNLALTADGRRLARIYGERDLLTAQCLRLGYWEGLEPASLAAMATCLVFEPRREENPDAANRMPTSRLRDAWERTTDEWARLDDRERDHKLPGSGPLSPSLAPAMYRWARGGALDHVLRDADMAAGDFVRWTKQTIDLLDQLSVVADGEVGRSARAAIDAIRRGIVAYSAVA